jgi:LPS-assembly lipoprotein
MLWSNARLTGSALRVTRAVALGAVLSVTALTGCGDGGFRPLYGSAGIGANVSERLAEVEIAPIPGRVGQQIRNQLIFDTTGGGEARTPAYRLEIAIKENVISTLVKTDGDALSQIFTVDAQFSLVRLSDKAVVLKGVSYGRAGFERNPSIFSNVRAQEDAQNRAGRTVGVEMKTRLAAFLASAS